MPFIITVVVVQVNEAPQFFQGSLPVLGNSQLRLSCHRHMTDRLSSAIILILRDKTNNGIP